MQIDAVVFGGGVAGLWTLDELVRHGRSALLLESGRLGTGQTVASQGIIHGGLKYTLTGALTGSAKHIREMPRVWRECLEGRREPDLSATRIRAEHCHLWRTDSLQSKLGMLGARIGLRVAPRSIPKSQRPAVLADCPGTVAELDEQVLSPSSFIAALADRNRKRILRIDAARGLTIDANHGTVRSITLRNPETRERIELRPRHVVLAAGAGNAALRHECGLEVPVMQRRPLHMTLVRGDLPELNGHCVDGAKTRVTITSDVDTAGRRVWQVGGHLAELGVELSEIELVERAKTELRACLPGLRLDECEWATYRVDRAEAAVAGGKRPETFQLRPEGNVITAWPTKLALAPELAKAIVQRVPAESTPLVFNSLVTNAWPRPEVALPLWETIAHWHGRGAARSDRHERVA